MYRVFVSAVEAVARAGRADAARAGQLQETSGGARGAHDAGRRRPAREGTTAPTRGRRRHCGRPLFFLFPTLDTAPVLPSFSFSSGRRRQVGTPGRIEELTKNDSLVLTQCRFLVLDEADGLLQQGKLSFKFDC